MSAASPTASSSSSRYQYRCTNSHHKTLNVLGKVKNFAKLSLEELVGYCGLMKNDNGCQSAADAAEALTSRFGWASSSRRADIETAWKSLESADGGTGEVLELDVEALSQKEIFVDKDDQNLTDKLVEPIISSSSIPIIIKNNAWERKVLLCEIDDNDFNISGDSGAVGRISVDPLSLLLDVKGRQYKGLLCPGPTVMLLNLAAPVGQAINGSCQYQQTARVEVLTNEYCQLSFQRDLLRSMMGQYTGSMTSYDDDCDNDDGSSGVKKKIKKSGNDDDSGDDADDKDEALSSTGKAKAPKISTITNRTRTTKKGTKKKANKTQKSKK